MNRRNFFSALGGLTSLGVASFAQEGLAAQPTASSFRIRPFEFDEVAIAQLQKLQTNGKASARVIAKRYLARIAEVDRRGPALNAVIELNPDVLAIAESLDKERAAKGPRGPLHGVPVLIKDNIATHDRMTTTAGSLALSGSIPPRDSFVAQKLREAGAVILGKTNLSEWANFRGSLSTSGWSGRGGQTRNPYVLDRNPSGSSSGSAVAVAANLCAIAVGTETDGSILSPSSFNGIVGIKPTLGLISRSGIIPIAHSQDTAGPMARSVTDAAILLGALAGTDPRDPATASSSSQADTDYTRHLGPDGLRGARLGVARNFFGFHPGVDALVQSALDLMRAGGAELIDPVDLEKPSELERAEIEVLRYEMKTDMNEYLAQLGPNAPVRTLRDIIEFNERHRAEELKWFGQEELIKSQAKGPLTEPRYIEALATCRRLARTEGIDAAMDEHHLDAIVAPTSGPAHVTDCVLGDHGLGDSTTPAAVAGYPSITVPAGFIFGLPVGLSIFGRAWSEPKLLRIAYGFEQASKARRPPRFLGTLKNR
ncbi:MAG TPA: amidase [Verrucomicrobiae bacterium]|nr:amidase [Verrucomicrobiae bacterium]